MIQATELRPDTSDIMASWDAQDKDRVHARRAKSAVTILINSISSGFIESLVNKMLPAYYAGIVKGPSVRLNCLRFDEVTPLGVDFYQQTLSIKGFQHDLDDRNYTVAKDVRDQEDIDAVNKMVEWLRSSKSSVEFVQKFIKESGLTGDEDPVRRMDLVLRKKDSTAEEGVGEQLDDYALTDELIDDMMGLMSEDKEMEEVRNHFKNWKF